MSGSGARGRERSPRVERRFAAALVAIATAAATWRGLPLLSADNDENAWDPLRDARIVAATAALSPAEREYVGSASVRDREWGLFLRRAREHVPEGARVHLLIGPEHAGDDYWYRFRAGFHLVPVPVEIGVPAAPAERDRLLVLRAAVPAGWEPALSFRAGVVARPAGGR